MNILHHKSWHVRNRKNIERVRRDEAKARRDEEESSRRRNVAESEARIDFLRKRSRSHRSSGNQDDDQDEKPTSSCVAESAADAAAEAKLKRDRELTEKRKQEDWEKKVGILTYLGQGLSGPDVKSPWYLQNHSKRLKVAEDVPKSSISLRSDPLFEMQKVQRLMKQSKHPQASTSRRNL